MDLNSQLHATFGATQDQDQDFQMLSVHFLEDRYKQCTRLNKVIGKIIKLITMAYSQKYSIYGILIGTQTNTQ